jgi:hypothetical protein
MKYIRIIVLFFNLLFIFQVINAQKNKYNVSYSAIDCNNISDSIVCANKFYKTVKIYDKKKQKNVYIVRASDTFRRGYGYVILSKKKKNNKLEKLEIGKEYKLYLVPYLDLDMYDDYEKEDNNIIYLRSDPHCIFYINVEGSIVRFDSDGDNNIYGSPNLQGLYYIPCDGTEKDREYPYFRSHSNLVKKMFKNFK